jgi:DNA invertase Pin-like site-specific DNA recombinase
MVKNRVAIYVRVSTDDRGQDPDNQLMQLRAWCAAVGHQIVGEYIDHASGTNGSSKRPRFAAMMEDVYRRQFDLVLVWALDRLSREGMVPTIGHLQRLASYGVAFHSYTEPMLSTDNELVRDIVLAVMASLAKVERQKISERTKAGLQRARANGKRLGRTPFSALDREKLRMVLEAGGTWHAASRATGIPYSTVKKHARALGYSPPTRGAARVGQWKGLMV